MVARVPKQRRSLSHVGGEVAFWGDRAHVDALTHALAIEPEEAAREHVHGFHTYPARLHPVTAARLIAQLAPSQGAVVLDPFCGSGTVVVEARLAGHRALGVDANPLAVQLAWLKSRGTTAAERHAIITAAELVGESAESRRQARAGATHRYGADDVAMFDPHVLLELDGLRAAIDVVQPDLSYHALMLVLSAVLVKVSKRTGDTATETFVVRLHRAAIR